jgi:predicted nucleotidyltransferase
MIRQGIAITEEALSEFCRRWKIARLWAFGSVLRDDFRPDSDIDLLVEFQPDAEWSLFDHAGMEIELEELFGRRVDLVSRKGVEQSKNWIRRKSILESAKVVYVAG